jgi:antitoxin (DNA-binding transcriptional repressor) of toxin-antitoxin stability system
MRSVGIKVLKNKLSEYVRLVAKGETVLVTDRDRVVAELVPPRKGIDKADAKAKWDEAVRLGHITPAKDRNAPLPPRTDPIMTFEEMMADLDDSRADRDIS